MAATIAAEIMPDLAGAHYFEVLRQLHDVLRPDSYFEIGVNRGSSFSLARCASVGVDPDFVITDPAIFTDIMRKPSVMFFSMGSDDFFAKHNLATLLGGPVDLAFLDGMHRCEYLLRDFMNTEACCKPGSVIALHDCLPPDAGITSRTPGERRSPLPHRHDWWAGDVWRLSLLLKRVRPDLKMAVLDASPTGMVLLTRLDPASFTLHANYDRYVEEMLGWSLDEIGVPALFDELGVQSTEIIGSPERLAALLSP